MNKDRQTIIKWLKYVGIVLFCTAIGGDFGMAAGLFLCFMLH